MLSIAWSFSFGDLLKEVVSSTADLPPYMCSSSDPAESLAGVFQHPFSHHQGEGWEEGSAIFLDVKQNTCISQTQAG